MAISNKRKEHAVQLKPKTYFQIPLLPFIPSFLPGEKLRMAQSTPHGVEARRELAVMDAMKLDALQACHHPADQMRSARSLSGLLNRDPGRSQWARGGLDVSQRGFLPLRLGSVAAVPS